MKQELIKKINEAIEPFVDDVLKTFENIATIRKDLVNDQRHYEDLCAEKDKELVLIKQQKTEDRKEHDERITELNRAKQDFQAKAKNYDDLTSEVKAQKKETDSALEKAKLEFARAKDVRAQADKIKEDAEAVRNNYQLKLDSLKRDFDALDARKKEQVEEDKKLKARENDIFVNETKNNTKAQELNDQDLRIRVERKEIDRLIKRYHLEESLKGK